MLKPPALPALLSSIMLVSTCNAVQAENTSVTNLWGMCSDSGSVFTKPADLPDFTDPDQIDISAGTIQSLKDGSTRFLNNVLIEKKGFRLSTNELTYNKNKATLFLPSASHFENEKMQFNSEAGEINNETESSSFTNVNFVILSNHMQGSSPQISLTGNDSTLFSRVSFSSCEPGKEAWTFSADQLDLDHQDESGSARNIVIRVKEIPVFYLPYISFPLGEKRRSGILTPELSFSGQRSGDEISLPYYWNIAPNQDATITPVYLEKRGLQLKTNYRYLTEKNLGEIDLEYLDNDRLTEQERYFTRFVHKTAFTPQFSFNINTSSASDSHYFSDFGQTLETASTSHLLQSADFQYRAGNWRSKLLSQRFQTINDEILLSSRPYQRRPQLTLNGKETLANTDFNFQLSAEWVNFNHQSDLQEQGYRSNLYPKLSWDKQGSAWFFRPTIGHRLTAYDIHDGTDTPIDIDDRSLSVFQLDSGLFFERKVLQHYTQTLEPRLYYLNVPAVDQSVIPLFDSSEPDFSFAQLFRDNRFNGTDRIADANQLTTALTSRLINDKNGNELFSASIGQIHYFEDREVSLYELAGDTQTASTSDIAAEFTIRQPNWSYRLSVLQDTETNEVDKGSFRYHYQTDNQHIFNLGYRYRQDSNPEYQIDQSDISFKVPLTDNWSTMARWNYSLKDKRDLENIFGFEYNSCCWAFSIIGKGHLTQDENNNDIFDRSILFTLVLKGLGSAGKANRELERAILGFHPEDR